MVQVRAGPETKALGSLDRQFKAMALRYRKLFLNFRVFGCGAANRVPNLLFPSGPVKGARNLCAPNLSTLSRTSSFASMPFSGRLQQQPLAR